MQTLKEHLSKLKERLDGTKSEPYVEECKQFKTLYFDHETTQSMMDMQAPMRLVVSYTETMMGFLLFNSSPKSIAMVGLGGGSLPKYCHHHFPESSILVLENNPKIIALRERFHIPRNDDRFEVLECDGAIYLKNTDQTFDVLLIDGFSKSGQPSQLCSEDFYASCFACLNPDGVMMINFSGSTGLSRIYQERIDRIFNQATILLTEDEKMNQILFVCNGKLLSTAAEVLQKRSMKLSADHKISLPRTLQNFLKQRKNDAIESS